MKQKKPSSADFSTHQGEVLHAFSAPEFLNYERGPVWYLVASIFLIGLIALSILTNSILLALALVLFVGVYWLLHHHEARLLEIAITKRGIRLDEKFFAFSQIAEFWLILDPPFVMDLKFKLKGKWNPVKTIHIFGQDPETLRGFLAPALKEVEREEDLADLIARALRL